MERQEEAKGGDFGDVRLERRHARLIGRLMERPEASLPKALTSAELEAAYRFVNNEHVTVEGLLAPHVGQTTARCAGRADLVVAHDTTEIRYSGEREGLGRLQTKGRGFYLHVALAIGGAATRDPLGVVAMRTIVRGEQRAKERAANRRLAADKESRRWWEQILEVDARLGKGRAVHVADREADAYELFDHLKQAGARFVLRLAHNRRVESEQGSTKLEELVGNMQLLAEREVELAPRQPGTTPSKKKHHPAREGRSAKLAISAASVTLLRPLEMPEETAVSLEVNVVRVMEVETPAGCEPVVWKLITTEPIETAEQVLSIVDSYRARWLIEEYFKALKTGCAIEKRQSESLHALLNVLGLYMPIACQMLRLRVLAREDSTQPAEEVLTATQVQIIKVHPRTSRLVGAQPTVRDALLAVAALGGHIKQNGQPGWIVLGRGLQDLLLLEDGWQLRIPNVRSDLS